MVRQDFSATPFSFLLTIGGKHGCKNGCWEPSKAFSHSDTSLASHRFRKDGWKCLQSCFVWMLKSPLSRSRCCTVALALCLHVAKERRASGCKAGEELPNWTLWSDLMDRRLWVPYLDWFEVLPSKSPMPSDLSKMPPRSVLYDAWTSTIIVSFLEYCFPIVWY